MHTHKLQIALTAWLFTVIATSSAISLMAQGDSTRLVSRAMAHDAKFIGSSIGGARILIHDAHTDELLRTGFTEGSTGDTRRIMRLPHGRYDRMSDESTAKFETVFFLESPRKLRITAQAPAGAGQATVVSSTEIWLLPGKHIEDEGVVLQIRGMIVDILAPTRHRFMEVESLPEGKLWVQANVVMMCGCTISPDGLWDGSQMNVEATIERNGVLVKKVRLEMSDTPNLFSAEVEGLEPGAHQVTVTAWDERTGNTGLDRVQMVLE